ncbi:antitoxin [Bacteroides gallinaceum]|uniref:antitoxin n=1 Tax=Bacteroides gallinaceum TaxID=1462571 RepID=UPI00195B628F|nr:antitoxin [Bacteroides gallinaceum]MBM6943758.1 antitoxin [Bacteroides gallinaceum]
MAGWARILGFGKKLVNNSATRSLGGAVVHPQRTLAGLGHATKTAVVGGGMGYLAWENIVNDKPVVRTVADVLVGEENVDKGVEMAGQAADRVEQAVDQAGEALQGVKEGVSTMNRTWGGIGTFLGNLTGGNGLDMFGNFFSNLGKGNVSGLGMVGLVASALLVFGRFGWLGKIGGLLLGMMLIGNNSRIEQKQPAGQTPQEEQGRQGGIRR